MGRRDELEVEIGRLEEEWRRELEHAARIPPWLIGPQVWERWQEMVRRAHALTDELRALPIRPPPPAYHGIPPPVYVPPPTPYVPPPPQVFVPRPPPLQHPMVPTGGPLLPKSEIHGNVRNPAPPPPYQYDSRREEWRRKHGGQ